MIMDFLYLIGTMMVYIVAFFVAFWALKLTYIVLVSAYCGFMAGWKSMCIQHHIRKKLKKNKADK